MATFAAILVPTQTAPSKVASLAAVTSSAEVAFKPHQIIAVNADQDVTIRFGAVGLGAADATFWRIPANTVQVFDLGAAWPSVKFFNLHASLAANIYIQPLSRV